MNRLFACLLVFSIAQSGRADDAIQPADPGLGRPIDFYMDVYPILETKCLACHSTAVKESGLILETAEHILKGGASGEGIVAGKPDESLVYQVAARVSEPVMPPLPNKVQAKPLTPREVGILRQWIEQGAKGGVRQVDSSIVWQSIPETYKAVYSLALSPDERFIAAGRGNRIFIYDLTTKKEVARLTDPSLQGLQHDGRPIYGPGVAHRDFVHSLAISPDGQTIASGDYRSAKLWERSPAALLGEIQLPGAVRRLTVDAEGRFALFVMENNEVRVWNLTNGTAGITLPPSEQKVIGAVISPDARQLATADETGVIRTWNAESGEKIAELNTAAPATALAVRIQGSELLVAHGDNVIRAWTWPVAPAPEAEPATEPAKPLREFRGHGQAITTLVVIDEKNELLSGARDNTVRLWNLDNAGQLFSQSVDSPVLDAGISGDGQWIAASGENQLVRIWNRNNQKIADVKGNLALARDVIRKTDDLEVAKQRLANADAAVKEAEKDVQQREESLKKAKEDRDKAVAAFPEIEKKYNEAKAKDDEAAKVLTEKPEDAAAKKAKEDAGKALDTENQNLMKGKDAVTSSERAVQLSEQSLQVAKRNQENQTNRKSQNDAVQKTAEEALKAAQESSNQSGRQIPSVAISPDGGLLYTAGAEQPLQTWALQTGKSIEVLALPGAVPDRVKNTATGAILTVDATGRAALWDLTPRWSLVATLGPPAENPLDVTKSIFQDRVTSVCFSPDGTLLATGGGEPSRGGELMLWSVPGRSLVREIKDAHSDTVSDIEFSRDGSQLVSGAADKFVKIFNVADGSFVRAFEGHTDHVLGVAFRADGSSLASSGADKAIKVWNTETGEQRRTIDNYGKQVTSIGFIGTTENLVSCSGDKNVKLHRASNGQNYRTFGGAADFVYAVIATRDEALVIGAGEDGTVRVWNGQNAQVITSFDPPQPAPAETAQN